VAATLILPFTPLAGLFGFTVVSPILILALALILGAYICVAELAKACFTGPIDKVRGHFAIFYWPFWL